MIGIPSSGSCPLDTLQTCHDISNVILHSQTIGENIFIREKLEALKKTKYESTRSIIYNQLSNLPIYY